MIRLDARAGASGVTFVVVVPADRILLKIYAPNLFAAKPARAGMLRADWRRERILRRLSTFTGV